MDALATRCTVSRWVESPACGAAVGAAGRLGVRESGPMAGHARTSAMRCASPTIGSCTAPARHGLSCTWWLCRGLRLGARTAQPLRGQVPRPGAEAWHVWRCEESKNSVFSKDDVSCLKPVEKGCNNIREKEACLASKDARPFDQVAGYKAEF